MRRALGAVLVLAALAAPTAASSARQNSKRMLIQEAPRADKYLSGVREEGRGARQIQPLACVSKQGGEKGICMFAWNCVEAGGTHLGTCIDRFYFGSCCRLGQNKEQDKGSEAGAGEDKDTDIINNEISDTPQKDKSTTTTTSSSAPTTTSTTTSSTTTSTSTTTTTSTTTHTTTSTTTHTTTSSTTHTTTSTTTTTTTTTVTHTTTSTTTTTTTTTVTATTTEASSTLEITSTTEQTVAEVSSHSDTAVTDEPFIDSISTTHPTTPDDFLETENLEESFAEDILPGEDFTDEPSGTEELDGSIYIPVVVVTESIDVNAEEVSVTTPAYVQESTELTTESSTGEESPEITTESSTAEETTWLTTESTELTTDSSNIEEDPVTSTAEIVTEPSIDTSSTIDNDVVIVEPPNPITVVPEETDAFPGSPVDPAGGPPNTDTFRPGSDPTPASTSKPIEFPTSEDNCKDNWVAVHIGPNGAPSAVGGLGGCRAKPGQYFNCSDTVIAEGVYNCTIVDAPTPGPPGGPGSDLKAGVCNDPSKIEECITETLNPTTTTSTTTTTTTTESGATEITTSAPTTSPSPSTSTNKPLHERPFRDVCGQRPWLNETFRSQAATPRGGRMIGGERADGMVKGWGRQLNRQGKIVNGEDAQYGEWPWQVSLRQWRTATFLHKCGAALLSENWAITAAHCVESVNPDELLLRMGEFDLNDEEHEPYTFQDRKVQIVASHPKFDPKTFEYDLALLRFYEPVVFTPNVIPVCIPEEDENLVGREAWVTGWGRLYEDGPLPSKMQKVTLPIINNTECESMYEAAGFREHIPHIFICAGYREGGKDSCEGDSGGPMSVEKANGRYNLAGIISWGIGCAKRNQPGVMTRIAYFRDWINTIIKF